MFDGGLLVETVYSDIIITIYTPNPNTYSYIATVRHLADRTRIYNVHIQRVSSTHFVSVSRFFRRVNGLLSGAISVTTILARQKRATLRACRRHDVCVHLCIGFYSNVVVVLFQRTSSGQHNYVRRDVVVVVHMNEVTTTLRLNSEMYHVYAVDRRRLMCICLLEYDCISRIIRHFGLRVNSIVAKRWFL